VLRNDLALYDRHAADWWDATHPFSRSLHSINGHRLTQVQTRWRDRLPGALVLDLGCGGGLMAEPLARAGAQVLGVDLSLESLRAAVAHRGADGPRYLRGDVRRPPFASGCADLVLCADVVEHVDGWQQIITAVAALLRPGGECYINTINRTFRARWLAVHLIEGLGLVPRGTHDPARFVTPAEITATAANCGLVVDAWVGQRLRLWRTLRTWTVCVHDGPSMALGYSAWLRKPGN